MKKLLLAISVLISLANYAAVPYAANYYVSLAGNDANNGTSPSTPWKTLTKVNSMMGSLGPGDVIRFNRGDVFYGFIIANKAGVKFATYGQGANPMITGFTTVSSWTNKGSNIWESTSAIGNLSVCNIVAVNGVNTAMGRTPNAGQYLTINSHDSYKSATINSLTGSPNYNGAELIARGGASWIMTRNKITAQNKPVLTTIPNYTNPANFTVYDYSNGQAFIQNAASTLDKANEWYYNPTTKKLSIYSTSTPSVVQAATVDSLIKISAANITIDSIDLTGANTDAVQLFGASGVSITNCNIRYCADMAIQQDDDCSNLSVTNCIIRDIENSAITSVYRSRNDNLKVIGNTFVNINMVEGSMGSLDGNNMVICSYSANGNGDIIQNNTIDSCSYCGIFVMGQSFTVQNNFVNHYCYYNTDGGGIYSGNHGTNRKIIGNIVLNGMTSLAQGIYVDDNGSNVTITGNTVSVASNGIYLHNAHEIDVNNNTVYSCSGASLSMAFDGNGNDQVKNVNVKKNTFLLTTSNVNLGNCSYQTANESETDFGNSDSNYISAAVKDDNAWFTAMKGASFNHYNLQQWQDKSSYDRNSKKATTTIPSADKIRLEYNATTSDKTISLGANYTTLDGKTVSQVTLPPYGSVILIYKEPLPPGQTYSSVAKSQSFTRNNCAAGETGSSVTYTVPAGKYTSTVSQADADKKATDDISANGQAYANTNGTCTAAPPAGNFKSNALVKTFTKNNCTMGGGSPVTYTVEKEKYTSTISQADADQKAKAEIDANGQKYANDNGQCLLNSVTADGRTYKKHKNFLWKFLHWFFSGRFK